ncbi:hypothetical protein BDB00DRAFT_789237 [Zychaea mexicana]|uniref:uncharacterized protein n=1 Tax=Zychaea mexicana TaxID=64656 RepID=UPI0022FE3595|nr:uncharacterized protein BDB00DRAFT_789237 [Zychaea mexicana]KAI9491742.1 hypothetical protein BDB00DRAFT_789237 [Zychaea mexicana]
MSQVKASPSAAPTQFSLHDQELHSSANRIMTRRASRSAQSQQHHPSVPLIVKTIADDENSVVPLDNDGSTAAAAETTTATTTTTVTAAAAAAADSDGGSHPRMATRSRSIDLNQSATSSAEESSSTTTPTPTSPSPNTAKQQQQQQQRRSTSTSTHHATTTSKTRAKKTRKRGVKASLSPTVASATSTKRGREERGSRRRNAKDTYNNTSSAGAAETTQLDAVKLQKLAELDELEKTVLDGTHAEYRERMAHAEKKRMHEMNNAKLRRDLEEADIRYTFDAFKKAAYDQFYVSLSTCPER